jgi:hypothetical protein
LKPKFQELGLHLKSGSRGGLSPSDATEDESIPYFYARVACILLKGYLACAEAGGNLLAARLLGHVKSDASIPINPATISNLGQPVDIHAIPWTGIKKPHVDHQKIMLKIKALPSPSPLFASRVKSEALVHRKRLLEETCWGTKIPPLVPKGPVEGRSFSTKTMARTDWWCA